MKKYLQWFGHVVRPCSGAMTLMMVCHVLYAVCAVAFVYACKQLVDVAVAVYSGRPAGTGIWSWFAVLASVVIVRIAINAFRSYLQTKTEIKIKNALRRRLFDILLHVQSDGGKKHHSGDILNRIQEDVRLVSSAFAVSIPNMIGTGLQFLAALAFFLYLDMRLALAIVIIVPLGIVAGRYISLRIRSLTRDIRNNDSKVQEHIQESVQHLTLLQTMEHASTSSDELQDLQDGLYKSEIRRTKFSVISRIFISLAFQVGYLVAFMWGVLGISTGTVTYGLMTAFLQLVGQIQRPLLDLSSQIPSIIHSTASIDRILEIESLPQEDMAEPVLLNGPAGVRITDLRFAYPESQKKIFDSFTFDFAPGSRTAIVGPTGVGKTTLIRLLLALLKPQSGSIQLYTAVRSENSVLQASGTFPNAPAPRAAEQNRIEAVSAATRCNLVYVPQGNSLFSGTIRENLLMGNPEATEQQLQEVLHIAAADFVNALPARLDSQCFEAGAGLSEGQAQRVAIARALLRPGSILLLDEFSSALDAETETLLMKRLTQSLPHHTMIFITHRDKIIDYCTGVLRLS